MQLIDGKSIAEQIKKEIAEQVEQMLAQGLKRPHLAAILVGHDGGSESYMTNKVRACEQCGFKSTLQRYDEDITEEELLHAIDGLNNDPDVDGFIVQLPLPKHIDEQRVIEAIDYRKDVDGFHPVNVGRLSIGLPCFRSATPQGIVNLLDRSGIDTRRVPQRNAEHPRNHPPSRHTDCRPGLARLCQGRYGETRRRGHRRGHHACCRRHPQERLAPVRRRRF